MFNRFGPQHLQNLVKTIADLALKVAATGLVLMTVIISWQVFARYALNESPTWSEAAALVIMFYFVLLAAAVGVYEGFHLGFRWLVSQLPLAFKRRAFVLGQLLVMAFGVAMAVNGMALVDYTSSHIIPTLQIPRSTAYWPFVICGGLIALFALVHCISLVRSSEADPWNS